MSGGCVIYGSFSVQYYSCLESTKSWAGPVRVEKVPEILIPTTGRADWSLGVQTGGLDGKFVSGAARGWPNVGHRFRARTGSFLILSHFRGRHSSPGPPALIPLSNSTRSSQLVQSRPEILNANREMIQLFGYCREEEKPNNILILLNGLDAKDTNPSHSDFVRHQKKLFMNPQSDGNFFPEKFANKQVRFLQEKWPLKGSFQMKSNMWSTMSTLLVRKIASTELEEMPSPIKQVMRSPFPRRRVVYYSAHKNKRSPSQNFSSLFNKNSDYPSFFIFQHLYPSYI